MSLRTRLIVSYIVIIIVALMLAFFTLILIARPIQARLATFQLAIESRQAAQRINSLYRQGASTPDILSRFETWAAQGNNRLLLIDPRYHVLADSQGVWQGQQIPFPSTGEDGLPATGTINPPGLGRYLYAATEIGNQSDRSGYVLAVTLRSAAWTGVLAELSWGFVVAGLVAMLVSLLLGVLIARSIALPLQRIASAAGAVAVGDYEHRMVESGPPEIKRVAASFNLMIRRVESSQVAMRDFVSNVSHELKTPLTSIQGFSQALMEGATQDEAARRRAAGIIYEEASRMTRLVEDLLDLARIDSGQVMMKKTRLDLGQLLNGTIDRLLPQAAEKQVELVKQWEQLPPAVGDGDRLAQVFTNFLENAIRHTPAGGRVTISGRVARNLPRPGRAGIVRSDATTTRSERGDFVQISIADTGPGIPPEELARIFERFYQVDKSRKRGQGTGLGLAIAKEIVEAHRGYLRPESIEGVGTKITVLLPVSEADALTVVSPRRG